MNFKMFILLLLLITLISYPTLSMDTIYLGDFTPQEDINFNFLLEINTTIDLQESIIIEFKDKNFRAENNTVPLTRLYLNFKTERFNLNSQKIQVLKDNLIKDAIGYFIPTTLNLKPIDLPGIYKNTVYFKTQSGEIISEKEMIFKINQWTRYEFSGNEYIQIINEDLKNNKVSSSGALILKIAANSDWELYGLLNNEGKEVVNKLNLYVNEKNSQEKIQEKQIIINKEPKLLIKGNATVNNDNYWKKLNLYMEIEDIRNIKAGLKKFPIIFKLVTLNQ